MQTIKSSGKAEKTLIFSQMCKFFSFYGVRALLVLYMIEGLKMSDSRAFSINAIFIALVEFSGILGGVIADRFLGLRKAVIFGSCFFFLGFISLCFSQSFFLSLSLVILGASLFNSNVVAFYGRAIDTDATDTKGSFTSFYIYQNIGGLISVLFCSFIASQYGYTAAFLFISLGMFLSSIFLLLNLRSLKTIPIEEKKTNYLLITPLFALIGLGSIFLLKDSELSMLIMPFCVISCLALFVIRLLNDNEITKTNLKHFLIYLAALILFFAVEDQMFSSLLLYSEREVDREIFGFSIPSSFILSLNPIAIFIFGKLVNRMKSSILMPFLLIAISFSLLALISYLHICVPILAVATLIITISIAELMLGPVIYNYASKVGGEKQAGTTMGIVSLSFSTSFLLSGYLSMASSYLRESSYQNGYTLSFLMIAVLVLAGGGILHYFNGREERKKQLT